MQVVNGLIKESSDTRLPSANDTMVEASQLKEGQSVQFST